MIRRVRRRKRQTIAIELSAQALGLYRVVENLPIEYDCSIIDPGLDGSTSEGSNPQGQQ
jgi:hypothetical protein